jgi:hypothetical protein
MNEHDFGPRFRPQKYKADRSLEDKIQYLLDAEEQLLQSISTRAALPGVLNGICSALDRQIANVVSLFSLPGEDPNELTAITANATLFGLHVFCSESIFAENGGLLGSLEMYSCVPRGPTPHELQLIERAKCLAAIAIELDKEASHPGNCDIRESPQKLGCVLEWPVSNN